MLLKEVNCFSLVESLFGFIYSFIIALCFVLVFEPLIERLPFKNRVVCCALVYMTLLLLLFFACFLIVPLIVNQWDHLKQWLEMMFSMQSKESELAISYENAFSSTIKVVGQFADLAISYLFAFFISLDFDEICLTLTSYRFFDRFFMYYDEFKEMIFQYIKALLIDVCVLFFSQFTVLSLFDVKAAFSLSIGLACLNLFPYFGSICGQILIFLSDYLNTGEFRIGLILCVFVIQQIEANLLQPVLFSRMMNIRPLYLFVSILFFGEILGFTGFLFAPVFAVAVQFVLEKLNVSNEKSLAE